jgi:hypothetical protein
MKRKRKKMMKIKRVGTISMSIVLIAFGVILFLSQINEYSALNMVLKVWPVILILMGLEILWYKYFSKDESIILKYDLFSVFVIFVILFVNIGIFTISESGLINRVMSVNYNMDTAINEYIIDETINKIVIDDANNLAIRATEDNKISGVSKLNVYASNKEEATELTSLDTIRYEKSGNTLYVYSVNNINNNYSYSNTRNLDIFLPRDIDVEVINCYNMDLIFDDFSNKWTFDGVSNINIRLDKISNVTIKAFVESIDYLKGNVNWSFDSFGEYVNGDGDKIINILNSSNITVNEL